MHVSSKDIGCVILYALAAHHIPVIRSKGFHELHGDFIHSSNAYFDFLQPCKVNSASAEIKHNSIKKTF
jgi:hypothetical protein